MRADLKRLKRETESTGHSTVHAAEPAGRKLSLAWFSIIGAVILAVLVVSAGLLRRPSTSAVSTSAQWTQITNFTDAASHPALSPDGKILAFVRGPYSFAVRGDLYVKLLPDGQPVQLTHDNTLKMPPAFSPDGSRVAYAIFDNSTSGKTVVVPVLGGQPQVLLSNASGLTWTDPQHVMFSEVKSGWHFAVVTSTESRSEERDVYVPPRETGMSHNSYLSPDGQWVLATEMGTRDFIPCRLVPFKGGVARSVGPQNAACISAAWSPDGKWMYFTSEAGGNGRHIWRQSFPNGTPQQITSGPTEEADIAVAPDGRSFITSVITEEENVWVHDSKGDRQISSEGFSHYSYVSPDATKLFYLTAPRRSWAHAAGELWVTDLGSGQASKVLPGIAVDEYSISPDGKRVVYETQDGAGKHHLWLASLDHRFAPKQISAGSGEWVPTYAPSGKVYFRLSEGDLEYLYRMNDDGSQREKLSPDPIIQLEAVSPDEKWVEVRRTIQGEDETTALEALSLTGGPAVRICYAWCGLEWSRDGKVVYFHLPSMKSSEELLTYVIPLTRGTDLPPFPAKGVLSLSDLPNHASLQMIDAEVYPGPNSSIYSFSKLTAHSNLYRIPLP